MLQTLANLGEFLGGMAVIGGVIFAVIQLRQYREGRQREVALELLHSFQTVEFPTAIHLIDNLQVGLSKKEVQDRMGEEFGLIYALMTTWESIGILVCRGELDLELVDDFFSGPIVVSWRKLKPHVMGEREEQKRETIEEWFQWLAERMLERESVMPPVPAHIAYKDWQPQVRPSG